MKIDTKYYIDFLKTHKKLSYQHTVLLSQDLRDWRLDHAMSLSELARVSSLSPSSVSRIENNKEVSEITYIKLFKSIDSIQDQSGFSDSNNEEDKFDPMPNILVVDDKLSDFEKVSSLMQGRLWVDYAANGSEAIELLGNKKYICIIMDIHMPIMDGIEATLAIRSSKKSWSDVPIIALTADPQYQQSRLAKNIGMNFSLPKPVSQDSLLSAIREVSGVEVNLYVPEQNSNASIQTVWRGGKVFASRELLNSDLPHELSVANLLSLKKEFEHFFSASDGKSNFDGRVVSYFQDVCKIIGFGNIDSIDLFSLVRKETAMLAFEKIAIDQWPEFLAAKYTALCSDFTDVLNTFPQRRKFQRVLIEAEAESIEYEDFSKDFIHITGEMRRNDSIIDDSVPSIIESIASDNNPEVARKIIVADQLESTSNVMKALVNAVGDKEMARHALENISRKYVDGFTVGLQDGAEEAGVKDGKSFGAASARAVLAKESGSYLSNKYPKVFGWLKRVGL